MALHITHPKANKLARKLAKQKGETLTAAVIKALEERLERSDPKKLDDRERRKAEILEILAEMDKLPVLDPRSPDEILGYDENGLPT